LKEVMAFLKTADADTIALQEVIEDKGGNTALTIANELGYECVYALEMHMSSRWTGPPREKEEIIKFGNAILTKHKIVSSKMHELSANEKRVAVQADIQIGDVILRSFSIHLKHDHPQLSNPKALALQNEQADNLVKVLGLYPGVMLRIGWDRFCKTRKKIQVLRRGVCIAKDARFVFSKAFNIN